MQLGMTIKKLREKAGHSQEELGFRLGVTGATISRIESDKQWPGRELLIKLAWELNVEVHEIFSMAEEIVTANHSPSTFSWEEEAIIGHFRKMPKDQRELFKAIGASFAKLRGKR
ncbi:MAG: XRE family transcriptional regulator [Rhodocyclaceae bacterium]|nr:MAG: XRE family transcriptional regulator [Rhodocyclaceae bacterium]